MHCLQAFSSKEILTKHKGNCLSINGIQGIQMPKKGSKVEFKDHHRQMPVLFVIYADFEAITEKVSGCQPNEENHTQTNINIIQAYIWRGDLTEDYLRYRIGGPIFGGAYT